ncbi:unnamed protein product [Prorocentrum cordatum]|uniref:Uncharacterized protein n=3 Tax=Prorocentrum cordatum TaxID=2364126 RepID=A0ABN9RZY5_9DINO|nr:unnamed protein product [Polarella glacialis]
MLVTTRGDLGKHQHQASTGCFGHEILVRVGSMAGSRDLKQENMNQYKKRGSSAPPPLPKSLEAFRGPAPSPQKNNDGDGDGTLTTAVTANKLGSQRKDTGRGGGGGGGGGREGE